MPNIIHLLLFGCIALITPLSVFAAPSNVGGLSVNTQEDRIIINWDPITDVAYYRIYVHDESILDSSGDWSDYERTEGNETNFTFTESPLGTDSVYVSVLAVDAGGEESEFFVEEASIDFGALAQPEEEEQAPTDSKEDVSFDGTITLPDIFGTNTNPEVEKAEEQPLEEGVITEEEPVVEENNKEPEAEETESEEPKNAAETEVTEASEEEDDDGGSILDFFFGNDDEEEPEMQNIFITSATAPTATSVLVAFSIDLPIDEAEVASGIDIQDAGGTVLPFTVQSIDGATVLLRTETQQRGTVYNVQLTPGIEESGLLQIDSTGTSKIFVGHNDGTSVEQPPANNNASEQTTGVPDVGSVQVRAQSLGAGTYRVTAEWDTPQQNTISHILVQQTSDGGYTFGPRQQVPKNMGGVVIDGVRTGQLGLHIQVVDTAGNVSSGVYRELTLLGGTTSRTQPTYTPPTTPVTASLTTPSKTLTTPNSLTYSGFGLTGLLVTLVGGMAGMRVMRRSKSKQL